MRLENEEAILDKMAYVLAKPATAKLVKTGREWPGVISRPEDLYGHERSYGRPDAWFGEDQPETAKMAITLPPCLEDRREQTIEWLATEVADRERAVARELREEGGRPMGIERVLATEILDSPKSKERGGLRDPRFAAIAREASRAAAESLIAWRRAYAEAWHAWSRGAHGTVFPTGTWWVVRYASAVAAPLWR